MLFSKEGLSKIDYALVIAVVLTVFIGILMIYSAGFDPIDKVNNGLYRKQLLWFIFGFILMIGLAIVNYQSLGEFSLHIYVILIILLIITTIFGTPVRNTRAWLNFGVFSIQPSEFMKLGLVIILAKYLEIRERDITRLRELVVPALLTFIPMLIILKQPDFGTAIIFIPILLTMLFVGGADISHLLSIVLIATIAMVVPMVLTYREWIGAEGSNFLLDFFQDVNLLLVVSGVLLLVTLVTFVLHFFSVKKFLRKIYIPGAVISLGLMTSVVIQKLFKVYQKRRILVFLNPDLDPQGSGYNIIQSKIAIGSGGFFGKGFLKGSQSQLGFLPEKSSDFIFSVVAEEWGFFGALVLLALFGFIIFRCVQTAFESKDKFGALLASGIGTILFFHILINIGMAVGIMPVTGLPLCFVSYGGSNLMMSMICIGIMLNIRARKFVY
ncbi:MAG TPA: rod shape-determining protein RodA [Spirochaetota bacterium]|nr:rod shape-determining protein RodA [Spirochaetota bacterium]HPC40505.1 rod shape-determining protein RodA [Spirochaetota bacterium]HQF07987.1 rod shape-determining protein RodA [Spirochaetota bacterium]HQH96547.1 rod shape-determining protein RodA [Spirochaetota bacterium]HQJ69719.1 rod shape-determining protein RodA [Spirochaetota bacterium]